jgi:hypothetical protein
MFLVFWHVEGPAVGGSFLALVIRVHIDREERAIVRPAGASVPGLLHPPAVLAPAIHYNVHTLDIVHLSELFHRYHVMPLINRRRLYYKYLTFSLNTK